MSAARPRKTSPVIADPLAGLTGTNELPKPRYAAPGSGPPVRRPHRRESGARPGHCEVRLLASAEVPEVALHAREHRAFEVEHRTALRRVLDQLPHQQAARPARAQLGVAAPAEIPRAAVVPDAEQRGVHLAGR